MKVWAENGMFISTILFAILAVVLVGWSVFSGQNHQVTGLKLAWQMIVQTLPLLILVFIVAGMMQTMMPKDMIASWIGEKSGLRGIMIGSVAGVFIPGGPMLALPMLGGIMRSGAGIGTLVAMMTSWSLISISKVLMEVGILGWRFSFMRIVSSFMMAPLAGLVAQFLFKSKA